MSSLLRRIQKKGKLQRATGKGCMLGVKNPNAKDLLARLRREAIVR